VVDAFGKIDEENFALLMEKLGGQDLYYYNDAHSPE